jgi:hypothetical protein
MRMRSLESEVQLLGNHSICSSSRLHQDGNEIAGIPLLVNGEDWRQALAVRMTREDSTHLDASAWVVAVRFTLDSLKDYCEWPSLNERNDVHITFMCISSRSVTRFYGARHSGFLFSRFTTLF